MGRAIEVNHLSKYFGDVKAVDDISFYVEQGTLFSFLGTNGAGKSTTIKMILTLLKQDAGDIFVHGYQVGKEDAYVRQKIGVVFQDSLLDPLLTVKENLLIRGSFYGLSKNALQKAVDEVMMLTQVTGFQNRPYGKLSGGERRRTDIARALIHRPSILILDEPTTGLDAESRQHIWQTILQIQRETKMTVFLTTHYIEEAAASDYVVVLHEGQIAAKGTPESLKNTYSTDTLILTPSDEASLRQYLEKNHFTYRADKSLYHVSLAHTKDAIPILLDCEGLIQSFEVKKSSLDEVFLKIARKEELL